MATLTSKGAASGTLAGTSTFYVINDPAGTPTDGSATLTNLVTFLEDSFIVSDANLFVTENAAYHRLSIGAAGCYIEAQEATSPGVFENLNLQAVEYLSLVTTAGGIQITAGNSVVVVQNLAVQESVDEVWMYPNDSSSLVILKTKDVTGATDSTTTTVTTGETVDGISGSTTITTGSASGTGVTGNLILTTGVPNSGTRGNIIAQRPIIAEPVASGTANNVIIIGGANDAGRGGDIRLKGGYGDTSGTGGPARGRVIIDFGSNETGLYAHDTDTDDPLLKINSENSVVGIRIYDSMTPQWLPAYDITNATLWDKQGYQSIDLHNRTCSIQAGPVAVLDWNTQELFDTTAAVSVDWDERTLNNVNGTAVIHWNFLDSGVLIETEENDAVEVITTGDGSIQMYKTTEGLIKIVLKDTGDFFANYKIFIIDDVDVETEVLTINQNGIKFNAKVGFFNTTPVVQQTSPSGATSPTGGATEDAEARAAIDQLITQNAALVAILEAFGLSAPV